MKKKPSRLIAKLVQKIKNDTHIICLPETFQRTRSGYWQKRAGAYSWTIKGTFHNKDKTIACIDIVTDIVKSKNPLRIAKESYFEIEIELDE